MCGAFGCSGKEIVPGRNSDRLLESSVFLVGPQQASILSILSWNINGIKTKLDKYNVINLLYKYDKISLNEVKTPLPVSLPGYVSYRSNVRGSCDRGETVLLVKNYQENRH